MHAHQHYLARLGQARKCRGGFPELAKITHFKCPSCGRRVARADWSEDHAPVKRGSSVTLGSATTCVLTCEPCNMRPGRRYEKDAVNNSFAPELDINLPGMDSPLFGRRRVQLHQESGLYLVRDEIPFQRSVFKAGFLLAFATLGYTWAYSTGVRPVRAALPPTATVPSLEHGYVMRSHATGTARVPDNVVIEVVAPEPCMIVRAADGLSVVLPALGHGTVPRVAGDIRARYYPWPRTDSTGQLVDREHNAGHLFHLDFCDRADHRTATSLQSSRVTPRQP
ncbi:MAG TPA: hypothetical protein DGG94_04635 [Micromonosporaceae bacterium]|nr:hypothetical protein [Micromonosporaceae bacterium]HCU49086.1 hypothetical protein [Micromonosporaceae bacterium]